MKKFFSLIALVGVFAACEPENLQTAFNVADATATVNATAFCPVPDFDASAVEYTYSWSVGGSTKSIKGSPAIEAGTVTVTATYAGATASTTVSYPKIFAGTDVVLTATIVLPYNAGGYTITAVEGEREVFDVEVYGLQSAAHGHSYGTAQEVEFEGDTYKVYMVQNATEFVLEDSYTYYVPTGAEVDDFEVIHSDFAAISEDAYEIIEFFSGVDWEEKSYDFSVSAWSLYNVINPVVTYVTPVALVADPGDSGNPEIGAVATFNMYEYAVSCGKVEMAHPDHASHYHAGHGHYTHDGHALHGDNNNAGGGIITAE